MTPLTVRRFVRELDRLKRQLDAGTLAPRDYQGRLAEIVRALRERGGLDADRAAATAALADAVTRGGDHRPEA